MRKGPLHPEENQPSCHGFPCRAGLGGTTAHLPTLVDPPEVHCLLPVPSVLLSWRPWLLIILVCQKVIRAILVLRPFQVLFDEQLS